MVGGVGNGRRWAVGLGMAGDEMYPWAGVVSGPHGAYEISRSDWSSDVCSSDLSYVSIVPTQATRLHHETMTVMTSYVSIVPDRKSVV